MKNISRALTSAVLALSLVTPALALEGSVNTSARVKARMEGSVNSSARVKTSTVDNTCVRPAVATREQALIDAWAKFNMSMMSAFTARKSALDAAWGNTDNTARNTAVKAAWEAFAKAKRAALNQWKTDQKGAWSAFRKSAKACKGGTTVDVNAEANEQL